MSLKNKILATFEENKQKAISGEKLAELFGVSRSAVWKAVNTLKKEGYNIKSATNKGYVFGDENDIISSEGIKTYLKKELKNIDIFVFDELNSTNTYAKKIVMDGVADKTVVVSNAQSEGRGRFGRNFYSYADKGIYMSMILKPNAEFSQIPLVTVAAAVAVCKAIEGITDKTPKIKWVNDVYLEGKKICGILTEAISDFESGNVEAVIVGIGINVKNKKFPDEIEDVADALNVDIIRNELIAKIIENMDFYYENPSEKLIDEYRFRLFMIGKNVYFIKNGKKYTGKAVDINEFGNLLVETENGVEVLNSGEISVREDKGKDG